MNTTRSTEVITLAAQMYQHLTSLDEMPFVGTVAEYAELNEKLAANARENLHNFLKLMSEHLDEEWAEMIEHTASTEAWEMYTS